MKTLLIKVYIYGARVIYFFLKLLPTQKKVVMISRQANEINLDFKLLGNELEKKYKVVYLCKALESGINARWLEKIKYGLHTLKQMFHLSTSQVCILDSYSPTVSILRHKKNLTVMQIWHSIGTMKKFGYEILDMQEGSKEKTAKLMHMHENYDIIIAASAAYKEHLAKGFNYPVEKVIIKTLPRVDMLLSDKYAKEKRKLILNKYPNLKEKKTILYCPTFRKDEEKLAKAILDLAKNIDYSQYNLVIKLHPLSKIQFDVPQAILDRTFSTFEMLFVADMVISDYSCIIYEAGLRGIPLYFYNFDMNDYTIKRGLNIDYKELPGYTRSNAKALIETLELKYDYQYLKKFINKYVTNQKDCTKKLVQLVEKYVK